jgi:hypothetical protein
MVGEKSTRALNCCAVVLLNPSSCTRWTSGTPSRPPPAGSATTWPIAPVSDPRSRASSTVATLGGVIPGKSRNCVAMVFGRWALIAPTSSGVSIHCVERLFCLLRCPSYEKKKNSLSRRMGPPMLPASWLRSWLTRCGASPCGPPHF